MGLQYLVGGTSVASGRVGVVEILVAIEFVGGREGSLLHLVVDNLHIDKTRTGEVNINTGMQEFLSQEGDVEAVGVESRDIAALKETLHLTGNLGKCGFVAHVVVGDMMNGSCCRRNRHTRIDAIGLRLLFAVRIDLQQADFHNVVVGDGSTCRLQVKEDDRLGEFEFHEAGTFSR